ncbi:CCR4-NOT transcription complex subunit 4 [Operophtera brumata]|uniref:CCR4-NOT transcription complex subunit 4 n=1 Tax=Operophtera brumata TaxID=104452 RepID=A0A0L7LSA7_OPEBR|nr:CCR4-NOT transcription complex subunit 4 [Operophtera brumata]
MKNQPCPKPDCMYLHELAVTISVQCVTSHARGVNNVTMDGSVLKGSLGTTKFCSNFMKNQPCPKPDCMYLHELGVHNVTLDGRVLKGSLGTTKYCANFMKNQPCPKPDCMYLHELGVHNVTLDGRVLKGSLGTTKYCANFMKNQPCPKPDCMYLHELGVHNVTLDGRVLKGSLGTTKYCANFMKNQPCPKPDCMYLHELASFTKEEMHAGLHQVYERKLHNQLLAATRDKLEQAERQANGTGNSITNGDKSNDLKRIKTEAIVMETEAEVTERRRGLVSDHLHRWRIVLPGKIPVPSHNLRAQKKTKDTQETKSRKENTNSKKKDKSKHKSSNSISVSVDRDDKPSEESKTKEYKNSESNNISESFKTSNYKTSDFKNSESFNSDFKNEDTNSIYSSQTNNSVFDNENYLTNELDELESDRHSLLENHNLLDNSDHSLLDDDTHSLLNDANNEVMMMQRHREMLAGLVDNKHMLPQMKNSMLNGMNGYGLLDRDMGYLDRHSQMNSQLDKDVHMRDRSQSELIMRQNDMLARQHSANFHQNSNMLPPFGMRVDTSMGSINSLGGSSMNTLGGSSMPNMPGMPNSMGGGFMLHNQQMLNQQMQNGLVNGFDAQQTAQQLRMQLNRGLSDERRHQFPHNMLSAERLEVEHKQSDNIDRVRRTRMAPPGFSAQHMSSIGLGAARHPSQHGFLNSTTASYSDWTQMDPAIMAVKNQPQQPQPQPALSQQELFSRFNQLNVQPPNGMSKMHAMQWQASKMAGWGGPYNAIPLPPGFAPAKPAGLAAECIDAN